MNTKMRYTSFVQEKVFELHEAMVDYFWNRMNNQDDINRPLNVLWHYDIVIPEHIQDILITFIDRYIKKEVADDEIDLSEYESEMDLSQYSGAEKEFMECRWLEEMYDRLAAVYLRPIFSGEAYD